MKKSPTGSQSSEPSQEIKREEKASHNYVLWGGVAFAVILIAVFAWLWMAGENPAIDIPKTGAILANNATQPKQLSKICEFCLETNDMVYKNSGACKPCFE